jgi:hypothetical protein
MANLLTAVNKGLTTDFSGKQGVAVQKATKKTLAHFDKIAKRAIAVQKQIDATIKKIDDLKKAKAQMAKDVASTVTDAASLANQNNLTDVFGNTVAPTVSNISSYLQTQLTNITNFTKDLAVLKKRGISGSLYQQLVAMGPEQGLSYADALMKATPAQLGQINSMQNQIQSQANALGAAASSQMYDAGIATAEGLLKGLKSRERALAAEARKLANIISHEVKKALKIHSPSRVAQDLGGNFGGSFANAIAGKSRHVKRAASDLAKSATHMQLNVHDMYSRTPVGGVSNRGGAASSAPNITQHVTVNTQEIDPRKHAADLGWELARRTR